MRTRTRARAHIRKSARASRARERSHNLITYPYNHLIMLGFSGNAGGYAGLCPLTRWPR